MSAPKPTLLDAGQVLQNAFDETTGRLRTDAEATIVNADIDVQLEPQNDGVHIGDKTTGNAAAVDTSGNLSVKDSEAIAELQNIEVALTGVYAQLEDQTAILNNAVLPDGSLKVTMSGGFSPTNFDDLVIERDLDDDPSYYKFYLDNTLISTIQVVYNSNKLPIQYKKV